MGISTRPSGAFHLASWHPPLPLGSPHHRRSRRGPRLWAVAAGLVLAMAGGLLAAGWPARPTALAPWLRPAASLGVAEPLQPQAEPAVAPAAPTVDCATRR